MPRISLEDRIRDQEKIIQKIECQQDILDQYDASSLHPEIAKLFIERKALLAFRKYNVEDEICLLKSRQQRILTDEEKLLVQELYQLFPEYKTQITRLAEVPVSLKFKRDKLFKLYRLIPQEDIILKRIVLEQYLTILP